MNDNSVVMGLLYAKIYTSSILPTFAHEDAMINNVLSKYRSRHLLPSELGVDICDLGQGDALSTAVGIMARLSEVKTPLDAMGVVQHAVEEIVLGVESVKEGVRVAPDDLIPLLAWTLVSSWVDNLESMLYWIKTFRMGDNLDPQLEYVLSLGSYIAFQS